MADETSINDFHTFTDPISEDRLTIGTDRSLDEMDSIIRITGKNEHGDENLRAHYVEVSAYEARILRSLLERAVSFTGNEDYLIILNRLRRLGTYVG